MGQNFRFVTKASQSKNQIDVSKITVQDVLRERAADLEIQYRMLTPEEIIPTSVIYIPPCLFFKKNNKYKFMYIIHVLNNYFFADLRKVFRMATPELDYYGKKFARVYCIGKRSKRRIRHRTDHAPANGVLCYSEFTRYRRG